MLGRTLIRQLVREPLRELWHRPANQEGPLDFLRSCAVLFVLAGHLRKSYLEAGGETNRFAELPFIRGGWIGVDLFFVLSGFLIGKQLWREYKATGGIRFGRFFLRRGLRIWPLYFFFLVFTLAVLGRGDFLRGEWWSDAVFLTNYANRGVVMGSWSLCTEEQFYLLAPLAVMLLCRGTGSLDRCRVFLWCVLGLLPVVRAVTWWHVAGNASHEDPALWVNTLYTPFHTHCDGLVMGLLLANYAVTGTRDRVTRFLASGWGLLAALLACVGLQRINRPVLDFTGITLLWGASLWFLASVPRRGLRLLDSRGFYVISRLSFGMYLNHEYMENFAAEIGLRVLPFATRLPALHQVATTVLFACLSAAAAVPTFCLIEYPFLQLREHLLAKRPRPASLNPVPARQPNAAASGENSTLKVPC